MSKALRIVVEEPFAHQEAMHSLRWWHPIYADTSGNNTPCYVEFMKVMQCISDAPTSRCTAQLAGLMRCMKREGLTE